MIAQSRPFGQRYAFVVVAVIFLCLLIAAGLRSAPSVMMLPLEESFGWRRDVVSLAAAVGIFLYGMTGPFAAALMERIGLRRTLLVSLLVMSGSTALSLWHLLITWGVFSGIGSGAVATVLGATIVNRWFKTNRGLVMGLMSASSATGLLVFLPLLASLAQAGGWKPVAIAIAIATAALVPLVYLLVPERPASIGQVRYGADADDVPPASQGNFLAHTLNTLRRAAGTRVFWYLFATFFICGFTTNGLVGTHLISFCGDMGIGEVQAAGLLSLMGIFDLIGTTLSGWLTDRFDPRKLLGVYYAVRGLSLIYLPYSGFSAVSLIIFAVLYGLDWIATVPPTLRLANEAFGDRSGPIVFGWIVAGHQVGAAAAAAFGGTMRELQGNYELAFLIAGMTGIAAACISLLINTSRPAFEPEPQAA
ncbi:MFS transporter [Mesorhizobium sp. M1C.F.Ca.ET.193.01.1.1]|uniref:MFS transporter n=1 Tax=unclassified Mesorhizobium TaxID=325217 RepID=UPI000FD1DB22|nr:MULTISPECIES: MFS transporter [unclassified Mesorhizobium]TGS92224.1 MFS transporter [bacterium M00.F.Ca.ET.177.01.1.1]TGQ50115.1 MFS transporter [Mesorhizobium sp. M1C.F.Ca.ET.210.01.1.1]TGQ64806.1 MFS transporter [Mesorhizobium sp. M1C.F.Ca.ET.212.01.1.1]TGQ98588.1 MFS transporter [Mesorhizobium sp. M1C.F.Ca.ET.204.01.1.1]TGR18780.1 MFS transporter [Mesorhizobium sp. M1C.F.Ca.ET.196.01.1.1]